MRLSAVSFLVLGTAALCLGEEDRIPGYRSASEREERELEAKLQSLPSSDNLREYMRRLSARPHHVGSAYGRENAEWILSKFKEWGFEAEIDLGPRGDRAEEVRRGGPGDSPGRESARGRSRTDRFRLIRPGRSSPPIERGQS